MSKLKKRKEKGVEKMTKIICKKEYNTETSKFIKKVTVGTYDGLEGLGVMAGVEGDEAHLAEIHAGLDLLDQLVVDFAVCHVAPPEQDVGVFQNVIRQTLIGIVESGEADLEVLILIEECLDGGVQTVGVDGLDIFFRFFVTEFIPYCNADLFHM